MRTTVRLDAELLAAAKIFAARHNRTLTSVLEDALRELLQRHSLGAERAPVAIDVFHGDGLMPGFELDSNARLHEAFDEERVAVYTGGPGATR